MTIAEALDFGSVFVFALTGALVASRKQLDIVGFIFVAGLTAVGGGTVRDVLLNRDPVFWLAAPAYVAVVVVAAVLVFFMAHLVESRLRVLTWLDAVALPIAATAGVSVALEMGQGPMIVILMAVITGCMGGLMRDVVCNEVPLVLKQGELYVSAALAGAMAAVLVQGVSGEILHVLGACAGVTFLLRAGSLAFGWRLPVYRSRPPRV